MSHVELDYSVSNCYWDTLKPSILGVYSMDGFGLPLAAARFRFRQEKKILQKLIGKVDIAATVLDLGSGVGTWTEYFASRFRKIVSVEFSTSLFSQLKERCRDIPNVTTICADARSYVPEETFDFIFMGGLLTCMRDEDIRCVLTKLSKSLTEGGILICRESTIPEGIRTRRDRSYQVVYRSREEYRNIFSECGFRTQTVAPNTPYIFFEIPCFLIKKWRSLVPQRFRTLPLVGRTLYLAFRLGYPWNVAVISRISSTFGYRFPERTNHFFMLSADR